MSDSSRRPTPRMPAGSSTLSERIASLQRKASESGAAGESSRPTSPLVRMGRVASEASAALRQMSSPAGSSSDIFPRGSAPAAGSSQAVRDRIARFQQNGGDPLIPRSSFGAPAPNPEERGKAVRAYPGAGGWAGDSPSLRPQMTGGWGGGSAGGVGRSLMPQATGPITWAGQRRQASTPASVGPHHSMNPASQRDAFADLDDEQNTSTSSSTGSRSMSSHAAEVATQAAALNGMNLSPSSRMSRHGSTTSTSSSSKGGLPMLPDAPSGELPVGQINGHDSRQISHSRTSTGDDVTSDLPTFPVPPSTTPGFSSTPLESGQVSNGSIAQADNSQIEIGVAGIASEELEEVKRRAELDELRQQELQEDVRPTLEEGPVVARPASVTSPSSASLDSTSADASRQGPPLSSRNSIVTPDGNAILRSQDLFEGRPTSTSSHLRQDTPAPPLSRSAVGNGLGSSPSLRSSHTLSPSTSDDGMPRTPPSSASIAMSSSTSSSSFAAQQAAREVIAAGRKKSLGGAMTPSNSGDVRYDTLGRKADEDVDVSRGTTPVPPRTSEGQQSNGQASSPSPPSPPSEAPVRRPAAAQPSPVMSYKVTPIPTRTSSMTGFPHSNEKNAPTAAAPPTSTTTTAPTATTTRPKRTGGGSIRRPPPGKMLNLADLDASDDEYEPGWANVISSTR